MIILVMGLPNAGKTTLSLKLVEMLGAVHWNADEVRSKFNDFDFSLESRIDQATRMRFLCDTVKKAGIDVIADFVCPTNLTREAFGKPDFTIWVDRIPVEESRFADTRDLFQAPAKFDFRYTTTSTIGDVLYAIKRKRLTV